MKTLLFLLLISLSLQTKGIDVSVWQENIDWKKVKSDGVKFAIIRAGYMKNGVSTRDKYFDKNYKESRANGIKIGAYWYAYAQTTSYAEKEAKACINIIKGHKFEYPIYYDVEDKGMMATGKSKISAACRTFCDYLLKNKFYCGIYASAYPLNKSFESDVLKKYPIWVAHYGAKKPAFTGKWGIWQYTSSGSVKGIKGRVDMDDGKIEYLDVIKKGHYNGY